MLASYHNHSSWSDGLASIADMIDGAIRSGVEEFGISDHCTLMPGGHTPEWAMPPQRLDAYVARVHELQAETSSRIALRLGLEVDWFPSMESTIRRRIVEPRIFDYLIGSVHYVGDFLTDSSEADWAPLTDDERAEIATNYWRLMRTMAESKLFDIVGHLDLYKKFGLAPDVSQSKEAHAALDAIAASGMVVEVNTAGWHKPCAEAYPSLRLLQECRRRNIPATINADAHRPEHVIRDFDRAVALLSEAGYTEVIRFGAKRERRVEKIEDALQSG